MSVLRQSDRRVLATLTSEAIVTLACEGKAREACDAFFRALARYCYQRAASHGKFRAPGLSVTVDSGLAKRRIDPRTLRRDESATIDAISEACGAALIRMARSGAASLTVLGIVAEAYARHAMARVDAGASFCLPYVLAYETAESETSDLAREQAYKAAERKIGGR